MRSLLVLGIMKETTLYLGDGGSLHGLTLGREAARAAGQASSPGEPSFHLALPPGFWLATLAHKSQHLCVSLFPGP